MQPRPTCTSCAELIDTIDASMRYQGDVTTVHTGTGTLVLYMTKMFSQGGRGPGPDDSRDPALAPAAGKELRRFRGDSRVRIRIPPCGQLILVYED